MATEVSFFVLLMVASGVALAAKRARLSYTVALVLAGLGLGGLDPHTEWLDLAHLMRELLFNVPTSHPSTECAEMGSKMCS